MRFCSSPYVRKRVAFSAMAPIMGAGKPYHVEKRFVEYKRRGERRGRRTRYKPRMPSFLEV